MVGAVQEGIVVRELNGFEGNGYDRAVALMTKPPQPRAEESKWYEEEIDDDLKLSYKLNRYAGNFCFHYLKNKVYCKQS